MKNILISIISIMISLLIVEGFLRYNLPYDISRMKEAESYFETMFIDENGYRQLQPNKTTRLTGIKGIDFVVSVNSKGLRGREIPYNNKNNNTRVLTVGDSFTFGYGVDDENTYPELLNELLKDRKVSVINAGVSGWGGAEQLEFISKNAKKYSPDYVVHGFYLNDVIDAYNTSIGKKDYVENYYKKKKILEDYIKNSGSTTMQVEYFLKKNTYIYPFLYDWYRKITRVVDSKKYTTVGSVSNPHYSINNVGDKGITMIDLARVIESDNKIYEYEVFSLVDTSVSLKMWHKGEDGYTQISSSKITPISYGRTRIQLDEPINVKKGDIVGFYTSYSSLTNEIPLGRSYDVYDFGNVDFISESTAKIRTGRSGGYSIKVFMDKIDSTSNKNSIFELLSQKSSKVSVQDADTSSAYIENINNLNCTDDNTQLISFYCKEYNNKQKYRFNLAIEHILNMHKKSVGLGAKFIVVYLTPIYEFYGDSVQNNALNMSKPYSYLSNKLRQHGIEIYDIGLKSESNERFYIPDTHYNENGNKAVAEELSKIFF
jgi:lysophospholipase L1-like esterase